MHSGWFLLLYSFFFRDCGWQVSNSIVHYDLISIEGWSAGKVYAKLFHFFHFFNIDFLFLYLLIFFSDFLFFFMIFGNILCVIFWSTLSLLKYYNYGILFGGTHLILGPWGGALFQEALCQGGGSHWIYMRQGHRKVTHVFTCEGTH